MKILLVEDDKEIAGHVSHALTSAGHDVDSADDGFEGLSRASSGDYAALILDRMLPRLDGLSLMKQLRADGVKTPILLLTTMAGIDDRVEGLEAGADDYLVKPFAFAELLARVNALGRRSEINGRAAATKLIAADLEMDLIARTVHRAGHAVELQAQEFRLLEYLMRNAGRAVTRAMLLEHVWNLHFDPRTNIVETHMSRLRTKLDRNGAKDLIHTIRGTGYIFRAD
ncbi:MAG TPA: response regulator transcription factor [Rhizomicrobium sp.]|nr:response regulator transcription factor [Rhizomicrobium sp.]